MRAKCRLFWWSAAGLMFAGIAVGEAKSPHLPVPQVKTVSVVLPPPWNREPDAGRLVGENLVVSSGTPGRKNVTYEILRDAKGRLRRGKVAKVDGWVEPEPRVIRAGTKTNATTATRSVPMPFETVRQAGGTARAGVAGRRDVTERVTTGYRGRVLSRQVVSSTVTQKPISRIIVRGDPKPPGEYVWCPKCHKQFSRINPDKTQKTVCPRDGTSLVPVKDTIRASLDPATISCPHCERVVTATYNYCPYCGKVLRGLRRN